MIKGNFLRELMLILKNYLRSRKEFFPASNVEFLNDGIGKITFDFVT